MGKSNQETIISRILSSFVLCYCIVLCSVLSFSSGFFKVPDFLDIFNLSDSVYAKNVGVTATVKDAVSISSTGDISFVMNPNQFGVGSTDVSVSTTNSTGYTLYVTSSGLDHSGNATNNLVHTSLTADNSNIIESLSSAAVVPYNTSTSSYDGTAFGTDKWGIYTFAAGDSENPVTDTSTSRTFNTIPSSNRSINSSAAQVQEDTTEITVGAKAGIDILVGTYENKLTFTAVANSVPYTYTINYNGNLDGTGNSTNPDTSDLTNMPSQQVQIVNDDRYPDLTITSTEPARTGYRFLGWTKSTTYDPSSSNPSESTLYTSGSTISMDYEDPTITLYAQWEKLYYTVTISNTNTTSDKTSLSLGYGDSATATVTPSTNYHLSNVSCPENYTCTLENGNPIDTSASATGTQTIKITNSSTTNATVSFSALQIMQTFSCSQLASVGSTATLTDARDSKQYKVAKLKDNRCWMISDLKFALSTSVALEPATTNVTSRITPDYSTEATKNTVTTWCTTISTDCLNHFRSISYGVPNGYLYNWYAATAGSGTYSSTGTVNTSICPKGWTLPTGGANSQLTALSTAYGGSTTNLSNQQAVIANLMATPTPALNWTGSRNGSSIDGSASSGYNWSRTAYSNSYAHYLSFFSDGRLYPQDRNNKYFGFAVRCVSFQ